MGVADERGLLIKAAWHAQWILRALGGRVLVALGLLMCGGGLVWTMAHPSVERIGGLAAFAVLVYWPLIYLDRKE